MTEQQSIKSQIQIEKDIKNKVVLCAGKDANALSDWALAQGAANVLVVLSPADVDENFDVPEGIEYVDTVIARNFFIEIGDTHLRRCFMGTCKRVGVDAFYVEVKRTEDLMPTVETVGEFGYLATGIDFKNVFRMQLDDGII